MNFQELENLWVANGGSAIYAPIAAAIAMAESAGNPNAIGDQGTSYGLWQVHWTVHPQFNPAQLFNPNYNAAAAVALSGNGANFGPWTTFNNGAYLNYLPSGTAVPSSRGSGSSSSTTAASSSTAPAWLDTIGKMPFGIGPAIESMFSAGIVSLGAVTLLLIGGIWLILGNETARNTVVTTTNTVKKAGTVAAEAAA